MHEPPANLVELGSAHLLGLVSPDARAPAAHAVLSAVLPYLRDLIAGGPHDYECSIAPPPWVSPESRDEWVAECDCTVLSTLYLLDHGRYTPQIEKWFAAQKTKSD